MRLSWQCLFVLAACSNAAKVCKTSNDCENGQVCGAQVCLRPECASDSDCPSGQACIAYRCEGAVVVCGDGTVGAGEQCDDRNTDNGDYCSADCKTATGGSQDGVVQPNEKCDDGNAIDDDYCANDRQTVRRCGDSMTQSNEACDDGNLLDDDYCTNDCKTAHACGDDFVQSVELCDDGNRIDADYCSNDCAVTGRCGDGLRQSEAEACDEGGVRSSALCTAACTAVTGTCGNAIVDAGETCDPGAPAANTYCHECTGGTGCLGGINNLCTNQGADSFGSGAGTGATGFTGCADSFLTGFDFATTTDTSRPVFTGTFAVNCRSVSGEGVVSSTENTAARIYYGTSGCPDYQPFARHQVRCPVGQVATGARGYETLSADGLTTVGFMVPLCSTPAQAKLDAPPLNRLEPPLPACSSCESHPRRR